MIRRILLTLIVLFLFSACTQPSPENNQDACPVTTPAQQASYLPAVTEYEGRFWYGTPSLWTNLPTDGIWRGLPHNGDGYVQKAVFWRKGYIATEEPNPDLIVSGRRVDGSSETFSYSDATNGWDESGNFMLQGITLPSEGCWEITAKYQDSLLTYVVEVVP